MDTVMIQDNSSDNNNKWSYPIINNICDEVIAIDNLKVPPPSPQDPSMLEAVFSKHLSAKIQSVVNTNHHENFHSQHAKALEKLLLSSNSRHQFKRHHYKKPSRIPILSSRAIHKKKKKNQQEVLINALEKLNISTKPINIQNTLINDQ